jgi:hypothetical protein
LFTSYVSAQNSPGTLRGRVTDPSGAVIPNATVMATASNGNQAAAVTDNRGVYEIRGLAPGSYKVTTSAKGFALATAPTVAVSPGQVQQFDIALEIEVQKEKLEVQEESVAVSTSASDNASAIVIKGKDLEALPDDPDELQEDLQALAGPSAGPNLNDAPACSSAFPVRRCIMPSSRGECMSNIQRCKEATPARSLASCATSSGAR